MWRFYSKECLQEELDGITVHIASEPEEARIILANILPDVMAVDIKSTGVVIIMTGLKYYIIRKTFLLTQKQVSFLPIY